VRFWTAASLVNELLQAQDEHRLHRFIAQALKLDLVVLDELGFIPFSPNGAQALFTFCSELYERLSFILTTNLKFADWVQVFGDERLTAALLDRLTHHAHIIELVGESYRFRQRMQQGGAEVMACGQRGQLCELPPLPTGSAATTATRLVCIRFSRYKVVDFSLLKWTTFRD
jgi:hypothetical protein